MEKKKMERKTIIKNGKVVGCIVTDDGIFVEIKCIDCPVQRTCNESK